MKSILAVRDPLFLFGVVPVAKSTGKSAASGVFAEEQHSGGEDRGQCDLERLAARPLIRSCPGAPTWDFHLDTSKRALPAVIS